MSRHVSTSFIASVAAALAALSGCSSGSPASEAQSHGDEAEFSALQARGHDAMGVDQYTSTHLFDALPDGGRIELQRDTDDPAGVAQIRDHLRGIATAFRAGDFSAPAFVHTQEVPGTAVMAARRAAITYTYHDLPRGGEVLITTRDPQAIEAIHAFMAFQRQDHRAGGREPDAHDAMHHSSHGPGHDRR